MAGHVRTTYLLAVLDTWTEVMDVVRPIDAVVYLDFAKAFDTTSHHRLLTKLDYCSIFGISSNVEDNV